MPELGSLDTCRVLRATGDVTPELMLTARDDVTGRVDAGTDDYLAKPSALQELLARVHALVRRGGKRTRRPRMTTCVSSAWC
ncbi:hypothetical protein ACFFQW_13165 [Umezawaea endophytica]|uniref:hypothetical protein n=1 Tax=Umezawaea endophytica TaxID=1654476 RepID=UPI0023DEFBDA|nr:hypothetical protein [Umezawaea endophytica]